MIKKTITYTDYSGNDRTEDFYFNLSLAEVMEMELGTVGGLSEKMQRLIDELDAPALMKTFKEILLKSYGKKSDDGKRFIKSAELSTEFEQTEAYSVLFMELVTDADAAAKFMNGIIPQVPEDHKQAKLPNK